MQRRSVERLADAEQVALEAAHRVVSIVLDADATLDAAAPAEVRDGARCITVALAGGSTPRRLYQLLATPPWAEQLPWHRIAWLFGDERCVAPDHPDSNFRMFSEALAVPAGIDPARIHRLRGEALPPDVAAAEYQRTIAAIHGVPAEGPPPRLDLVLLGLGEDGHTASLFPHTAALQETERWVVANPVPSLGVTRLTMTAPLLTRATHTLVLATGGSKAAAVAAVLEGPYEPRRLPAQIVDRQSERITWLVDRAAASKLRRSDPRISQHGEGED